MKIIKIKHEQKVGKSGRPFESCQILTTNSRGDEAWISGFGSEITHTWKEGDEVEVTITSRQGNNGNTYWNFEPNEKTEAKPSEELLLLKEILKRLEALQGDKTSPFKVSGTTYQNQTENAPQGNLEPSQANTDDIDISEIPF